MFLKTNIYKKITKLLELDKPLIIFDIETTGTSLSSDKIVELAYIKIWDDTRTQKDDILINPEMTIPPEASAIHGITDKDIANKPSFQEKAQEIWNIFNDCYYSGFNILNFDLPILRREFIRVGMDFEYDQKRIIDSKEIFKKMVPNSLNSAYKYYVGKPPVNKYNAMNDAELSAEILARQLERYNKIMNWEYINKIHNIEQDSPTQNDGARKFYWIQGEAYFAFSKYRDKPLTLIAKDDPGFLQWILEADFSDEVKEIVRSVIENYK